MKHCIILIFCILNLKYIYYFGESKTLEEWHDARKDDQGAIFKDLEIKFAFANRIFKERDLIWRYDYHDYNIKLEIENIKTLKNNLRVNIENLAIELKKKKRNDEINEINKQIEEIEKIVIKKIE